MTIRTSILALPVLAVLLTAAAPAGAETFKGLHLEGWYGKLGLETGVVFARERATAPLLGAAATFVRMNDHLEWYGLQADLLADWNGDRDAGARWSVGPEAGVLIYGVDLSYFGERVDGASHHGFQARAKLTVGVAAIYVRAAFVAIGGDETSLDTGLQLKLPVYTHRNRRSMREAARAAGIAAR